MQEYAPIIFREGAYGSSDLLNLRTSYPIWGEKNIYEEQLTELFEILHPQEGEVQKKEFLSSRQGELKGNWIYFPWNGILMHCVNERDYFLLRTNRNRNLITRDEQEQLYSAKIGVIGLSIGSYSVQGLVTVGIGFYWKLGDFDTISTSNLNRINARMANVGDAKLEATAHNVYEIDPYASVQGYQKAVEEKDLELFLENPRLDVVFELCDDFELKVQIRLAARKARIPVIMLTNLGDTILVDVERYDIDTTTRPFNGQAEKAVSLIRSEKITDEMKKKLAVQIVGMENVPPRALASLKEIGKTLVGRPQLGSTVMVNGGIAAYLVRKIVLKEPLISGRSVISLPALI